MKETETMDENFFQEIMSESKLELLFSDFEDNLMLLIEKKIIKQSSFSKNLKLSWLFFIIGSVFGIVISVMLPLMHKPIFRIQPDRFAVFFQIFFIALLFIQINVLPKFKRI